MRCSFQVVVSLIEIFLLDLDLGNLVQGRATQVIVIVGSDYLLKIQDGVTKIIELFERFGLVEVGLAECL